MRPQFLCPNSCVFQGFIYSQDRSAYCAAGKYVDRFWEYINRSQTHECGNWDWGRLIPFLGIQIWDFRCSAPQLSPVPFPVQSADAHTRPYLVSFPMTESLKFNTALEMRWFWLVNVFTSIEKCALFLFFSLSAASHSSLAWSAAFHPSASSLSSQDASFVFT